MVNLDKYGPPVAIVNISNAGLYSTAGLQPICCLGSGQSRRRHSGRASILVVNEAQVSVQERPEFQ